MPNTPWPLPGLPAQLGPRFTLLLLAALGLLLASGVALLLSQYRDKVLADQRHHLRDFENGMVSSLNTLMQSGQASHVRDWLEEARRQPGMERIQILRPDGKLAFRDLTTVERVNRFLGHEAFQRPGRPARSPRGLSPDLLQRALAGEEVTASDWSAGRMTHLVPLRQEEQCQRCHGYTDNAVLGAVRITASLEPAQERVATAFRRTIGYTAATLLAVGGLALLLLRFHVLRPLRRIRGVVQRWGRGDLSPRLDEASSEEMAGLTRSLNWMAGRLQRTINEIRDLISQSSTGMVVVDEEGTILFSNPAAQQLMNRTAQELAGAPLGVPVVSGGGTEIEVRRLNGETGIAELGVQPTEWDGGTGYLVTFHDVTERRRAEEAARFRAMHDDLTGLPNRTYFRQQLEDALARARERGGGLAVVFLDLDRFKEINDSLGHAGGDELLRQLAKRLRRAVRDTDTVARMSGDEFTILLEDIADRTTAVQVAEKLKAAVFQPVTIGDESLTPAGTLGLSLFPQDGTDADDLLMGADTAMYNAKEAGRNRIHTFDREQGQQNSRRFHLEQALRRAQTEGEFHLVYQPQVDLGRDRIKGVEALLRWDPPGEGPVSPGEFIPLLEETGLIESVGEDILRQVLRDLADWDARGASVGKVWVNVSARQLAGEQLLRQLERLLADSPIAPHRIGIELTESSVAGDIQHAEEVLSALRDYGFAIAMDDFGKGYSALTFLRQLPFDLVKIDIAFIRGLPHNAEDHALVRAIIAMAHSLGMEVLAEGVETREQLDCLMSEGCDYVQGFYLSHPLAGDALPGFLAEQGRHPLSDQTNAAEPT
jgi:diguanylate cyclase (GGDEF)-like protein